MIKDYLNKALSVRAEVFDNIVLDSRIDSLETFHNKVDALAVNIAMLKTVNWHPSLSALIDEIYDIHLDLCKKVVTMAEIYTAYGNQNYYGERYIGIELTKDLSSFARKVVKVDRLVKTTVKYLKDKDVLKSTLLRLRVLLHRLFEHRNEHTAELLSNLIISLSDINVRYLELIDDFEDAENQLAGCLFNSLRYGNTAHFAVLSQEYLFKAIVWKLEDIQKETRRAIARIGDSTFEEMPWPLYVFPSIMFMDITAGTFRDIEEHTEFFIDYFVNHYIGIMEILQITGNDDRDVAIRVDSFLHAVLLKLQ